MFISAVIKTNLEVSYIMCWLTGKPLPYKEQCNARAQANKLLFFPYYPVFASLPDVAGSPLWTYYSMYEYTNILIDVWYRKLYVPASIVCIINQKIVHNHHHHHLVNQIVATDLLLLNATNITKIITENSFTVN